MNKNIRLMKQIITIILFAIVASSCTPSEEPISPVNPNSTLVPLSISSVTTQTGENTLINFDNAKLGVFLMGGNKYTFKSNVSYKYSTSTSKWSATSNAEQILLSSDPATICAYYPYGSGTFDDTNKMTTISLISQKYDESKDVCFSKLISTANNLKPEVSFVMEHAYAKLTLNITRDVSYTNPCKITNVTLANAGLKSAATLDIATGVYSAGALSSVSYDPAISFIESKSTVTTSVLMIPVSAIKGEVAFSLTVDGNTIVRTDATSLNLSALEAGRNYVIPITINSIGLSIKGTTTTDWSEVEVPNIDKEQ